MQNWRQRVFSNRQLEITVYKRIVTIMVASKLPAVNSKMFPHRDIHKYTWTSPDGKTHNQIDHTGLSKKMDGI